MKTFAALLLLCACLPRPGGECSSDANCLGGPAGSFCAESVCQGPPLGSLETLPSRAFGRGETLHVRLQVQRVHGTAGARVLVAGQAVEAAPELDGALGALVPLALVPAGVEGPMPLSVELRDDLGHAVTFPASVTVDDLPPRAAFDAVSSTAVLRGTRLELRISAHDLTAVSVDGAARNPDGSFSLPVDTSTAPPGASAMTVTTHATDAAGNRSAVSTQVPLTRLKYFAQHPEAHPVTNLVLTDSRVLALVGFSEFWFLNRTNGAGIVRPVTTGRVFPQIATDGSRLFFGRITDANVCRLLPTGATELCCPYAPLAGGPILDGDVAIIATGTDTSSFSNRLTAILGGNCFSVVQSEEAGAFRGAPVIGPDGSVYAGAAYSTFELIFAASFDGSAWTAPRNAAGSSTNSYLDQPSVRGAGTILFPTSGGFDAFRVATLSPGEPAPASRSIEPGGSVALAPTVAADGATLVVVDKSIYAVNLDGSIRWSRVFPNDLVTTPATAGAGGVVYAGLQSGLVVALSVTDGSSLWSYQGPSAIRGSLAAGCDGVLYAGTDTGILALVIDSPGLADSTWPKAAHDVRGTGDARRPLRSATGGCLE